jgi:hypothetical protein
MFKTGSHVNNTHWQYTAKCTGCTSWTTNGVKKTLDPKGVNRLAFAYSDTKPSPASSPSATMVAHQSFGYWYHDFSSGQNAAFASLVATNTGHSVVVSSTSAKANATGKFR